MSTCSRSASTGKNSKIKVSHGKIDLHNKSSELSKCDRPQHNLDQMKHTNPTDKRINTKEDFAGQERIKQIMDLTRRSEDEVIMALHDSDGDLNRAVNDLLEGISPEWEVKKKKARQSAGSKQSSEQSGASDGNTDWEDKHSIRNVGSSRIRGRANHTFRGWRRRENKENEKNLEDSKPESSNQVGNKRDRGIPARSGRGGRGGGRGLGPRTFANRGELSNPNSHSFTRPIDTWTGHEEQPRGFKESKMDSWNTVDTTEDWDNEEYTGSLADTKVFTPSAVMNETTNDPDKNEKSDLVSDGPTQSPNMLMQDDLSKILDVSTTDQNSRTLEQPCSKLMSISSIHLTHSLEDTQKSTSLAVQSEYFSHLTQPINDCLDITSGQPAFLSVTNNQPQRQVKHRPRVPPPSKIPSTAVEMPGDAINSGISFLDVQFGALEFGSDANMNDTTNQERRNNSGNNLSTSNMDSTSVLTKTPVNSITSLPMDSTQVSSSQNFCATTPMLHTDNPCISNDQMSSQGGFSNRSTTTQSTDIQKQDLNIHTTVNSSTYNATTSYPTTKSSYSTPVTTSNFNTYTCSAQTQQTSFACASSKCDTSNFSAIASVTQVGYSSPYTQSNIATFNQTSSSSGTTTGIYNQTSTACQGYPATVGFTSTPISQYQSQPASTNTSSNTSSYMSTGFQHPSTFQSTVQAYQPSITTFTSTVSQGSNVYTNAVHSVYSNSYSGYGCQNQTGLQDHKLSTTKDLQFNSTTTTTTTTTTITTTNISLVVTTSTSLGLTSSSVNTSQTKTSMSNALPKSTVSSLVTNSGSNSISGSGSTGNIAPILSHQFIMGQSVPYATFQQPHMYSYEDLQLMQQRMPHMPTTGYYDAALGYQTTNPVTSLCSNRSDALSGVQGVQGVQTVQGQYTSINDTRFARTDSSTSPVSSTMSQQTATQHQQPLMNPIPPGYAYFYGGSIMPAGGFQYGTPAIYPQIAAAGNAGTTSGTYNTKPGSYGSGYGSGTNYDSLTNPGTTGDYKNSTSAYSSSQITKNGSSTGTSSTAGTVTDISSTMYAKGHVALNKVNSYEKQTFHSATPPPFGLTNSQNTNVISGYGAAHLFIPTVPHQLHQPLHQDNGNSTGQRTNSTSQNKTQAKSGYSTSYWAGGN